MAKLTATILATMAGTATAFAPAAPSSLSKASMMALNEFAKGMVGGEGPEPMPFNFGGEKTSKNFDPVGFSEVSFFSLSSRSIIWSFGVAFIFAAGCDR